MSIRFPFSAATPFTGNMASPTCLQVLSLLSFAVAATAVPNSLNDLTVTMTIASCPSPFAGQGNVVTLHFQNNVQFEVKERFDFPDGIDTACPAMESSIMTNRNDSTILSFTSEWGLLSVINQSTGKLTSFAKGSSADEYLFDGYTSMKPAGDSTHLLGVTPHVTQNGFCSDGCFRFGLQNVQTGVFSSLEGDGPGGALPFKASSSQTSYFHMSEGVFYIQGSYPLSSRASCDVDATSDCLLAINATNGKLVSSKLLLHNVIIYDFFLGDKTNASNVLAFVYGFESICKHPYESYAFVHLDLTNGKIVDLPVCMTKSITVHQKPEMGTFSKDGKYFALANGDTEGSDFQFLLFNTETGEAVVNSDLKGLKKALHVSSELPLMQVWGISSS